MGRRREGEVRRRGDEEKGRWGEREKGRKGEGEMGREEVTRREEVTERRYGVGQVSYKS